MTVTQAGNAFYFPASRTVTFNIIDGPTITPTIIFPSLPDFPLGIPGFHVAALTSGGTVTVLSDTPGVCSINSGMNVTLLSMGTCSLTASRAADNIYFAATPVTRTFQVVPPNSSYPQSITVNNSFSYAEPAVLAITAGASSGLQVIWTSETPAVCTAPFPTVVMTNAPGTCVITLTQPGNGTFAPAPPQTISFPVIASMSSQTIAFTPVANKTLGDPSFFVAATASSGLPVSYSSTTPAVCSLSENMVTLVGQGTCKISAIRTGDVFLTSASASISFSVAPIAAISPAIETIRNGALYPSSVWAPSSYGSIFGSHFLVSPTVTLHDASGKDFTLEQSYVSDGQINVLIPTDVSFGSAMVAVTNSAGTSQLPLTIAAVSPGILSKEPTGGGPDAEIFIVNADNAVTNYFAGERAIPIPPNVDVILALNATGVRGHSPNGVTALVGGVPAEVIFAGRPLQLRPSPGGQEKCGAGNEQIVVPIPPFPCVSLEPKLDQVYLLLRSQIVSLGRSEVQLTVDGIDSNKVVVLFDDDRPVSYTRSR
jgi:uncharacterized protein (TIGR03437 family)